MSMATVTMKKNDALSLLTNRLGAIKSQLETLQVNLKDKETANRYALNMQVGELKKQFHLCKVQLERVKKDFRPEVTLPNSLAV
jgi:hypothetical protein